MAFHDQESIYDTELQNDDRILQCDSTVLPYCTLGIMQLWAFLAKNITLQPASNFLHSSLTVLVRHSQAKNAFRVIPKPFQQVSTEF